MGGRGNRPARQPRIGAVEGVKDDGIRLDGSQDGHGSAIGHHRCAKTQHRHGQEIGVDEFQSVQQPLLLEVHFVGEVANLDASRGGVGRAKVEGVAAGEAPGGGGHSLQAGPRPIESLSADWWRCPPGLLAHLGFLDLIIETVNDAQEGAARILIGSERLVAINPALPEVRVAEQPVPPVDSDGGAAEEVGALVAVDVGRIGAPNPWIERTVVSLRGVSNPAGAQAAVAIPRRSLFNRLGPIFEEKAAEAVSIDVEADVVGDVVLDPGVDIQVSGVAGDRIGEGRAGQIGHEVREVVLDIVPLQDPARINRRSRGEIRVDEDDALASDGDALGPGAGHCRHEKGHLIGILAVNLEQVASGDGRGVGVFRLQVLDIDPMLVPLGFLLHQVEAPVIVAGDRPAIGLAKHFDIAGAGGVAVELAAHPIEDGVVHQPGIEPVDAVKHPIRLRRHVEEGQLQVLVEFVPKLDGHVVLGLAGRARAAVVDTHARC